MNLTAVRTGRGPVTGFQGYSLLASLFKRVLWLILATPLLYGGPGVAVAKQARPVPEFTVLVIGDSLAAGYGLSAHKSFPVQLEAALRKQGMNVDVKNAGVSGDTTSSGLARLAWLIERTKPRPDLVILEFGANDALRGIDPSITDANLDSMLGYLTAKKLKTLFVGMMAPPNMGKSYTKDFNAIFPALAEKYRVSYDPFFLDGVAAKPELNQKDGMHPNAKGVAVMVDRLAPRITRLLKGKDKK